MSARWSWVPFDEAFRDITGGQPKLQSRYYESSGCYPVIDQGTRFIGGYTDDKMLLANVKLPAILFGDHTKTFKWVERPFVVGADGVKIIQPRDSLDARFAFHYLRTVRLPQDAGYSRHFKFLKRASVPIPPTLIEQRRIAEILDKADAIRRKRSQALAETDTLLRAVFLARFGDPATDQKRIGKAPLSAFGRIVTGNTPPRTEPGYFGEGIEWIKSDNINTPSHFLTPAHEQLSPAGEQVARVVPAGSILVTCIAGSPDSIGKAAMADRRVAFNQQINAIIPNVETDPYFLYTQTLVGKRLIQRASTNSMKGMVSKSKFETVEFIRPKKVYQNEFGLWCRRYFRVHQKLHTAFVASQDLFDLLSERAFGGRL